MIIVFLKDPQTIIKETPFIEQIEAKARLRSSQNMEINGAASNGFLAEVGIKSPSPSPLAHISSNNLPFLVTVTMMHFLFVMPHRTTPSVWRIIKRTTIYKTSW